MDFFDKRPTVKEKREMDLEEDLRLKQEPDDMPFKL